MGASVLEEQRVARVESGERIAASLEAEFQKLQEAVAAEEKLRFEAEGTMLGMVEDVRSRMLGEIKQERVEREAVQSKLLGLLEDTCNRIESGFCGTAITPAHGVLASYGYRDRVDLTANFESMRETIPS